MGNYTSIWLKVQETKLAQTGIALAQRRNKHQGQSHCKWYYL